MNPEMYTTRIVTRDGLGQTPDDYHATVTRHSDGAQLVFISRWRWWLKWLTRPKVLPSHFRNYDKRQAKLAEVEESTHELP